MKKFVTVVVAGRKLELDAPGLKIKHFVDREPYVIWIAPARATAAGFTPKSVRLRPNWDDPADFDRIALRCRELQAKAQAWVSPDEPAVPPMKGTLGALIAEYIGSEDSPFNAVRLSTRMTYKRWIKLLSPYREALLSDINLDDLTEWYAELGEASDGEGPHRPRRASSGLQMLRLLLRFGADHGHPCGGLLGLVMRPEFDTKPHHRQGMTQAFAERFIDYAISAGAVRMALAQACQFELGLRQSEVIGEWVPVATDATLPADAIVFQRQLWIGGLTFAMIDDNRLTLPSGEMLDLEEFPLVRACLARIAKKDGPLIVRDDGRPYDRFTFSRRWREVATGAGLDRSVHNSDSAKARGQF